MIAPTLEQSTKTITSRSSNMVDVRINLKDKSRLNGRTSAVLFVSILTLLKDIRMYQPGDLNDPFCKAGSGPNQGCRINLIDSF